MTTESVCILYTPDSERLSLALRARLRATSRGRSRVWGSHFMWLVSVSGANGYCVRRGPERGGRRPEAPVNATRGLRMGLREARDRDGTVVLLLGRVPTGTANF